MVPCPVIRLPLAGDGQIRDPQPFCKEHFSVFDLIAFKMHRKYNLTQSFSSGWLYQMLHSHHLMFECVEKVEQQTRFFLI